MKTLRPYAQEPAALARIETVAAGSGAKVDRKAVRRSKPRSNQARSERIVLFGLFGSGNSGNDGSMEAMLRFLRQARPEADLACICADPELIASRYSVPTVPIDWSFSKLRHLSRTPKRLVAIPAKLIDLVQTFRRLRRVRLVIIPGTGILDDFSERPWRMPYSILKWCLAARLVGAKIAFVSIGAGPINHPASRWLMTTAARLAHYRSYRDEISRDFMESIGLDVSRDPVYPDIAFKLPAPESEDSATGTGRPLRVGVGLMSYSGWYNFSERSSEIYATYIEKMSRFVLWLLDQGHHIRFLQGETSDRRAIDDVLRSVLSQCSEAAGERIVAEPTSSLHDLMGQIARTDIVVATRFHNIVCALKLGRPTVSLGYARKNDVLLADMGLSEFCQHVEEFDLDRLVDQFSRLAADRAARSTAIRTRVADYARRLAEQDQTILSTLL
jgi:polysaccharide pyruvyl transferase WcaK-like protein